MWLVTVVRENNVPIVTTSKYLWVEEPLAALLHNVRTLTLPMLVVLQSFRVGPLPCCGACVMIHIVDPSPWISSDLPARWQWLGSFPWCASCIMIHIIPTSILVIPHLPSETVHTHTRLIRETTHRTQCSHHSSNFQARLWGMYSWIISAAQLLCLWRVRIGFSVEQHYLPTVTHTHTHIIFTVSIA